MLLISEIVEILRECTGRDPEELMRTIAVPPKREWGVYGSNLAFQIAAGKNPIEMAASIVECINGQSRKTFLGAKLFGGYVNFYVADDDYYKQVLESCFNNSVENSGKKVFIEISPENIGEQFHLLNYRAACIANFLCRLYENFGYDARMLLFWNDCGVPAGRLLYAYQCWGKQIPTIETNPVLGFATLRELLEKAMLQDNSLLEEVRRLSLKLEQENSELTNTWRYLRAIHLNLLVSQYRQYGFFYDEIIGESEVAICDAKEMLLKKRVAQIQEDGSIIMNLEAYDLPNAILFRKDGASLYMVRDIAELIRRLKIGFDKNIYVVSRNQMNHFSQMFTAVSFTHEYSLASCIHVPFGFVEIGNNKQVDEVLLFLESEAYKRDEHHLPQDQRKRIAKLVSETTLRLYLLSRGSIKDVFVDINELLDFQRTRGAYLLYSALRAMKLLHRSEGLVGTINTHLKLEEKNLIILLDKRNLVFQEALTHNEPFEIVKYALELCTQFNQFYDSCSVILDGEMVMEDRRKLVQAYKSVMETILYFIGIERIPEEI